LSRHLTRAARVAVGVALSEFSSAVRTDHRREPTATELAALERGFLRGLGATPPGAFSAFTDEQIADAFRPLIRRAFAEHRVS
jgi:hypothetical protein